MPFIGGSASHLGLLASAESLQPVSLWLAIPFVALLAMIALMPFVHKHWWEANYPKVAFALVAVASAYYLFVRREPAPLLHALEDYVGFVILLFSLYVISGGIVLRINRRATPLSNTMLLLLGSLLANVVGTTGAAMLFIRPYIHMNRGHMRPFHIVFFIFCVANVGGSLTPIGDPPLFLGYLEGIPFSWTVMHLLPAWSVAMSSILLIFFVFDWIDHRREPRTGRGDGGPQVHVLASHNAVFIAAVVAAVFRPTVFAATGDSLLAAIGGVMFSREVIMLAATGASWLLTPKAIYQTNQFHFGPIKEVAILFLAIFCTMIPAIQWLGANSDKLALSTPGQYYYATGSLSAVLDNAPTYLTMLRTRAAATDPMDVQQLDKTLAQMRHERRLLPPAQAELSGGTRAALEAAVALHGEEIRDKAPTEREMRMLFLLATPQSSLFIIAISIGAVFFGACTYIGNGPNFMVRSIAESAGISMPSFIGYVVWYALPILVPVYVFVWFLFLRLG